MHTTASPLASSTHSRRAPRNVFAALLFAGLSLGAASALRADQHTAGAPALNSRPGAEYTVYLNVAGFNYNGSWSAGELGLPGSTLAVGDVAANATFDAAQIGEIKNIWSRMAQSYIGFNVNVTTVDPAVAAGQAATDTARQAFYDATPNLMHTVIGSQVRGGAYISGTNPLGKWYSTGADGVSGLGVVAGTGANGGNHTNWMFTEDQQGAGFINGDYIGAISAHENGHAFSLSHQGDWQGNTVVNVYTNGDAAGTTTTPGTYVATIGNASDRQRVTWRVGDTTQDTHTVVNDVQRMLAQNSVALGGTGAADLHLVEDGIGHTRPTATTLALNGDGTVNFSLATGVIVPVSESSPNPIGAANYTEDWFSFTLASASTITLTARDGTEFLTAGVADGVGTLRSTLGIYDVNGVLISMATEDASTLFETYTGLLAAGTYYADVASFGGHVQNSPTFNAATYYDMGAFFLTGSGFTAAPEPGSLALLGMGGVFALLRRNRRRAC